MRGGVTVGLLMLSLLLVTGCTGDEESSQTDGEVRLSAAGDPAPQPLGDPVMLDSEPASLRQGEVAVEVPPDAVVSEASLIFGQQLGTVEGEHFGRPVAVDAVEPLAAPVELRWDIGALSEAQRASIVPLRWDDNLEVWAVDESEDTQLRIESDELVIVASEFSWRSWSWAADFGQLVGERTGSRREGPSCDGELPSWVANVVDPGEGTSAAAIQVCFEPDGEDTVTVRVVNNRPFTQRLEMTEDGQQWAWTWPGEESYDVSAAVTVAAREVFDSNTAFLLPPLSETAVGIDRPEGGGAHFIAATATVNASTFLIDVVDYVLGQVTPGGFEDQLLNEFVALVYECGGSAALSGTNFSQTSTAIVEVLASCVNEVMTSNSVYGARFDAARIDAMASASPERQAELVKLNRSLHQLASAAHLLEAGRLAFYFTDQLQNAYVGDLTLSISATGRAGELGDWTAACDDLAADSNRLFRNLTLRDPFYDTSRELWEFDELEPSVEQAVQPLRDCTDDYLNQLANLLPEDWADTRAAQTTAGSIAALAGPSGEVEALIEEWAVNDLACRGGPGDLETNRACNRRAEAQEELDALGWCIGRRSDPPGERGQWHECGPDSWRAESLGRYETEDVDRRSDSNLNSQIIARWGPDGPMNPLGSDDANGSGCSPGSVGLPDGVWFGFVRNLGDRQIAFDLACLYTGERAYAQGASPEGADIAVRNDVLDERLIRISPNARFFVHPDHDIATGDRLTFGASEIEELRQHLDQRMGLDLWSDAVGVWILVEDNSVLEMLEFWYGFVS